MGKPRLLTSWVTVAFVVLYGMIKKVKIFDAFIEGAVEGLHTLYMIIPTITGLVVAVEMNNLINLELEGSIG